MKMNRYSKQFYARRLEAKKYAARAMLTHLFEHLASPPKSAADVGCGSGVWLAAMRDLGVEDIRGFDGPWVEPETLLIPTSEFVESDLSHGRVSADRRFDVAMSLEVAEHIDEEFAADFVQSLVGLADLVVFSAAVPGQGGTRHVNERWPSFWKNAFAAQNYVLIDLFRDAFWNDEEIPVWYRQNMFLYAREGVVKAAPALQQAHARTAQHTIDAVHPSLYAEKSFLGARTMLRRLV